MKIYRKNLLKESWDGLYAVAFGFHVMFATFAVMGLVIFLVVHLFSWLDKREKEREAIRKHDEMLDAPRQRR